MKKILLFLVVFSILLSCKSEKEVFNEKIKTEIKQYIEDNCFKKNIKIEFLEYNLLEVDTLKSSYVLLEDMQALKELAKDLQKFKECLNFQQNLPFIKKQEWIMLL